MFGKSSLISRPSLVRHASNGAEITSFISSTFSARLKGAVLHRSSVTSNNIFRQFYGINLRRQHLASITPATFCRRTPINNNFILTCGNKRNVTSQSGSRSKPEKSSVTKEAQKSTVDSTQLAETTNSSMLQRWLAPKEMPKRGTLRWYGEMVLICTVFAITGTSTMVMVRPAVSEVLGLKGSMKDGPWSYRICSLVIMTPLYSAMLVVVGTIFGRHAYFRHFSVKMFSRFGIPPELMDKNFHKTAKNFRKY